MGNFFKTFWAALLAFVVANILMVVVGGLVIGGMMVALSPKSPAVGEGSVLKIDFAENIVDGPASSPQFAIDPLTMSMNFSSGLSLLSVTEALDAAAEDPSIKGIYINYLGPGDVSGTAMMEELRAALEEFRASGKFIITYNKTYSPALYWLASLSDRLYINPEGAIEWHGMAANVVFYKGLIDKLGVNVEILRHGTFKSAVEPYMMDRMSPANRMQTETMVSTIWNTIVSDVAEARNLSVDHLMACAENLTLSSPAAAVEEGFFDAALYEDEVMKILAAEVAGVDPSAEEAAELDEPTFVTLGEYSSTVVPSYKRMPRNKVAVVYASGEIVDGTSGNGVIGDITLAEQLAKQREDSSVKAVVLRVNSPGGSALASEVIWREMELLRAEKPVVVSMGDYAASGGYYISAPADIILSNRTTLTGSIGVFGLMYNAGEALEDKIGITFDVAKSNSHADLGAVYRPMSATEREYMMGQVERTYTTFVNHVSAGRNMTFDEVDAVGQGRVWCGADAEKIGLVDGMGTLADAIDLAADRAGVAEDYRVVEVLPASDPFSEILASAFAKSKNYSAVEPNSELGRLFSNYNHILQMLSTEGVQARMPYTIEIR